MKAKIILVGGFLGAGKTTSILRFARWLAKKRYRVAIITNDQASGLVDSELIKNQGIKVEEIPGGCFCCRSDVLVDTIRKLDKNARPHFIIAEPVGSCTDLVATVIKPLQTIYKAGIKFAPFSVLVDPFNMLRTLGLEEGRGFAPEIEYILKKQIEEAEIVVVNKSDIFPKGKQQLVETAIQKQFPNVKLLAVSARNGNGCKKWFDSVVNKNPTRLPVVDVDYETYAEGEELLGWFNGVVLINEKTGKTFATSKLLTLFTKKCQTELKKRGALIAHFKNILEPVSGKNAGRLPSRKKKNAGSSRIKTNGTGQSMTGEYVVSQIGGPKATMTLLSECRTRTQSALLTINLRAQAEPSVLTEAVTAALSGLPKLVSYKIEQSNCFKPSKPTPIHRIGSN